MYVFFLQNQKYSSEFQRNQMHCFRNVRVMYGHSRIHSDRYGYASSTRQVTGHVVVTCFHMMSQATIFLVCFFLPKVYVVVWRPERNVREHNAIWNVVGAVPVAGMEVKN